MTCHGWRWYAGHALLYGPGAIALAVMLWLAGPLVVLAALAGSVVLIVGVFGVALLGEDLIESDRKAEP